MDFSLKNVFKIFFLIGLITLFLSLFLDWFYLEIFNNELKTVAYWSYNPFSEWTTPFSEDYLLNMLLKPNSLSIPLIINFIFIISIVISGYGIICKDLENKNNIEKSYLFSYIYLFLLLLNAYYLFAFPLLYLIPNDLYFPFMIFRDMQLELDFYYCVGLGYLFQIIAFIMIFPYTLFYYQTVTTFETKKYSQVNLVNNYIEKLQDTLDIDKFIAEEELKLKITDYNSEEINSILNKQINKRRILS